MMSPHPLVDNLVFLPGLLLKMKRNSLKEKFIFLALKAMGWPLFKPLVIFFFAHVNGTLHYDRIISGTYWEAVYHPKPLYPLHVLILPKASITSLLDAPNEKPNFYPDLFCLVQNLIEMFDLENQGYRLITNGGPNQKLPQWHWHLISEGDPSR